MTGREPCDAQKAMTAPKPLAIADDLVGGYWVEFSDVVVVAREWLRREYGPHRPPNPCRCGGTGTVTVVIPLADAVLLDDRPCPAGFPPANPQQATDATGEKP